MDTLQDPILFRGIERFVVVLGAIFFGYLGFKLFIFGAEKGHSQLSAESRFFKIFFSGTGPGLFFYGIWCHCLNGIVVYWARGGSSRRTSVCCGRFKRNGISKDHIVIGHL